MPVDSEKQPKQKLTLAIDRDIIEKAKNAGINISAITEKVLESMTFDVEGATRQDVVESYEALFEVIKKILKKYNAEVEVGVEQQLDGGASIMLKPSGLWAKNYEGSGLHEIDLKELVNSEYDFYHEPFKILYKLLKALIDAAEKNKEELKELEVALRFVKALSNNGQ